MVFVRNGTYLRNVSTVLSVMNTTYRRKVFDLGVQKRFIKLHYSTIHPSF